MKNQDKFPNNIYEPISLDVSGNNYKLYRASFNSLYDLYSYLTNHPKINTNVFRDLHSEINDSGFAGIPYTKALEELIGPPRGEYKKFVTLSDNLGNDVSDYVQEYIYVKSPGGGYIDIPSYCSGDPFCYRTAKSIYTPKFIKLNVLLSYSGGTSKSQVMNRALIIAALVNAFEHEGYIVEINSFDLSVVERELVNINVNVKNNDETFNIASLYKSLCYVEFLRRILFRVLETIDVKDEDWQYTYGRVIDESFARKALNLDENDIYIDQPRSMNISGEDIVEDFTNALKYLSLEDKIDIDKVSDEFSKEAAKLKRTIK